MTEPAPETCRACGRTINRDDTAVILTHPAVSQARIYCVPCYSATSAMLEETALGFHAQALHPAPPAQPWIVRALRRCGLRVTYLGSGVDPFEPAGRSMIVHLGPLALGPVPV